MTKPYFSDRIPGKSLSFMAVFWCSDEMVIFQIHIPRYPSRELDQEQGRESMNQALE